MKDQWNQRYGSNEFFYGRDINDFLGEKSSLIPEEGQVLMLAEGEGRNAIAMARKGYRVTAVDWSEIGLKKLDEWAKSEKLAIETVCADLTKFDFGTSKWDAIVSIWFHLPSANRKLLYSKYEAALKLNGVFLLEAYRPKQLEFRTGGPPDVDMLVTASELSSCWKHLEIVSCHEIEREISEGKGHKGRSAVVQFVGKRTA